MSGSFLPSLWSSINHSLLGSRGASIVMKSSAVLVRYPSATTFEITRTAFATTLWILGGNLQRLRSHKTQRVITTAVPKISRSNTGLMLPAIYGLSRFARLGIKRFGCDRLLIKRTSQIILLTVTKTLSRWIGGLPSLFQEFYTPGTSRREVKPTLLQFVHRAA